MSRETTDLNNMPGEQVAERNGQSDTTEQVLEHAIAECEAEVKVLREN